MPAQYDDSFNAIADRDSASVGDTFEVRRARIGVVGTINKDIGYEVVGNGVGGTTNWIDTAFINYGFNKKAQIRTGRFKQPFSLEEQTSSNNIDFMERSYGNQMVPGKRLGAMVHGAPMTGLTYGVSVYQDGFNEITNQSSIGSKQAARFTLNLAETPRHQRHCVAHWCRLHRWRLTSRTPPTLVTTAAPADKPHVQPSWLSF
jgi:phosphate-selective porin OprO and OprP